jgi:hypothetical protein
MSCDIVRFATISKRLPVEDWFLISKENTPFLLNPQTDPDTLKAGEAHRRRRDITRRVSLAGGISP